MHTIYADHTVSVTELKRNYASVVRQAEGLPVAVLNNNRPEAYLVPAEAYERLMEKLEDLEDALIIMERKNGPWVDVNLEDLKNGNI